MASTTYTFETGKDNNVIHDGLWELVKAGKKLHNIPSRFFNGPGKDGNKLEVSISTSYIRGKKTYNEEEFCDAFDLLGKRRMKFKRRVELTAQLKINDWIHDKTLDSTKLTAVFYVDHNSLTDALLGVRLFDWSNADSNIYLEHPVDVPAEEMRTVAALVYRMGKEVEADNKADHDKMMAIFAKVKI